MTMKISTEDYHVGDYRYRETSKKQIFAKYFQWQIVTSFSNSLWNIDFMKIIKVHFHKWNN